MKVSDRIELVTGDITALEVDAVVNAANSSLMGGGGVDGAIHRAGGAAILAACREIRSHEYPHGLPTGKAVITTAGNLPARHVIHAVGPIWSEGSEVVTEQLADAYRNSLVLARDHRLKTVAFPAISTGVYGFPRELAAPIAYGTVKEFLEEAELPRKVLFVFFSQKDLDVFKKSANL